MAEIDVSELLSDPDFVDPIDVVTRTPSVNYLGENVIRESILSTFGSVQPAAGEVVQRLPEALRVENVSSFFFKGLIVTTATGEYSSVLVFKGKRYQVRHVFNYSNWGAGWTEGACVAEVPS